MNPPSVVAKRIQESKEKTRLETDAGTSYTVNRSSSLLNEDVRNSINLEKAKIDIKAKSTSENPLLNLGLMQQSDANNSGNGGKGSSTSPQSSQKNLNKSLKHSSSDNHNGSSSSSSSSLNLGFRTPRREDPDIGSKFWVAQDDLVCRERADLESPISRRDLGINRVVICAGHLVELQNGIVRMPIHCTDEDVDVRTSQGQAMKKVHWVTLDGSSMDPMKKHLLIPWGDELLFFRVFLANKFGAFTDAAWYNFYKSLDTNKNNDVSMYEFEAGLLSMKYPDALNDADSNTRRKRLLAILDQDGSGTLSYSEFSQIISGKTDLLDMKKIRFEAKELARKQREQELIEGCRWKSVYALKEHAQQHWYGMKKREKYVSQQHQYKIYAVGNKYKGCDMRNPFVPRKSVLNNAYTNKQRYEANIEGNSWLPVSPPIRSLAFEEMIEREKSRGRPLSRASGQGTQQQGVQQYKFQQQQQQQQSPKKYYQSDFNLNRSMTPSPSKKMMHQIQQQSESDLNNRTLSPGQTWVGLGWAASSNNSTRPRPQTTAASYTGNSNNRPQSQSFKASESLRPASSPPPNTMSTMTKSFTIAKPGSPAVRLSTSRGSETTIGHDPPGPPGQAAATTVTYQQSQTNNSKLDSSKSLNSNQKKPGPGSAAQVGPGQSDQILDSQIESEAEHKMYGHNRMWNERFAGTRNDPKLPSYFRTYFDKVGKFSWEKTIEEQISRSPSDYKRQRIDALTEFELFKNFLAKKFNESTLTIPVMEKIFQKMDVNNSGDLSIGEWNSALQVTIGYPDKSITAEANRRRTVLFNILDINGTGELDVYEFCRGLHRHIDAAQNLEEKLLHRKENFKVWKPILPSQIVAQARKKGLEVTVGKGQNQNQNSLTQVLRPASQQSVRTRDLFGKRPFTTSSVLKPAPLTTVSNNSDPTNGNSNHFVLPPFLLGRPHTSDGQMTQMSGSAPGLSSGDFIKTVKKRKKKYLPDIPFDVNNLEQELYVIKTRNRKKNQDDDDDLNQDGDGNWGHYRRPRLVDETGASSIDALKDLQEAFLLKAKHKRKEVRNFLAETVDYAMLCSPSGFGTAISQIANISNYNQGSDHVGNRIDAGLV